jgi:hypothetical protein
MGRMGQIICPKESTTCRERDDASMFHVKHPDGSIGEHARGAGGEVEQELGEPGGSRGAPPGKPASKQGIANSELGIAERWWVALPGAHCLTLTWLLPTAYCLLPTAYCLLPGSPRVRGRTVPSPAAP